MWYVCRGDWANHEEDRDTDKSSFVIEWYKYFIRISFYQNMQPELTFSLTFYFHFK